MPTMKTSDDIRRENLADLIREAGSEFHLAEIYGCTEAAVKTWARGYKDSKTGKPKGIGTRVARKLEEVTGKECGWMDKDHSIVSGESNFMSAYNELSKTRRAKAEQLVFSLLAEQRAEGKQAT